MNCQWLSNPFRVDYDANLSPRVAPPGCAEVLTLGYVVRPRWGRGMADPAPFRGLPQATGSAGGC